MAVTQWTLAQVVTTTGTTPTQLGDDIPLPEDAVTVIDVEAHEIRTDGTLSKTHNARRVFHNEGGTIDAAPLTIMVPSAEPKGALTGSVLIDDSGTDAEVKVVGPSGVAVRWEIWVQVATTTANEFDATTIANCRSWASRFARGHEQQRLRI